MITSSRRWSIAGGPDALGLLVIACLSSGCSSYSCIRSPGHHRKQMARAPADWLARTAHGQRMAVPATRCPRTRGERAGADDAEEIIAGGGKLGGDGC